MTTHMIDSARHLSDEMLLARVKHLAADERRATVALIELLAEVDRRRLYLEEGYSSLFTYCTEELRLSEHAAYGRIEAARAARRFPIILERLEEGSITLTTVCLLASLLTAENHQQILDASRHKSKRQVEELIARLRPLPPVPSIVRRLPAARHLPASSPSTPAPAGAASASADPETDAAAFVLAGTAVPATPSAIRPAVITPLAPERYKVQFTASAEMYEKFRHAQALLRHQIPDGDPAAIFDRALTALLEDLTRQKHAATGRPRTSAGPADAVHEDVGHVRDRFGEGSVGPGDGPPDAHQAHPDRSRHIPAAVRREVWQRDGGRCAFAGAHGRRCGEVAFLEFHHVVPYSMGGEATVANIQLRCRAHNAHEASRAFGRAGHGEAGRGADGSSTRSGPS